MEKKLATGQGIFYLAAGLWPVVHYKSFEKVTGPKEDEWLVKTVGLLIAASGAVILGSAMRAGENNRLPAETIALGAGHASVLGGVSLYYSAIGRISKIYLLDALTEWAIAGLWVGAVRKSGGVPQLQKRSA